MPDPSEPTLALTTRGAATYGLSCRSESSTGRRISHIARTHDASIATRHFRAVRESRRLPSVTLWRHGAWRRSRTGDGTGVMRRRCARAPRRPGRQPARPRSRDTDPSRAARTGPSARLPTTTRRAPRDASTSTRPAAPSTTSPVTATFESPGRIALTARSCTSCARRSSSSAETGGPNSSTPGSERTRGRSIHAVTTRSRSPVVPPRPARTPARPRSRGSRPPRRRSSLRSPVDLPPLPMRTIRVICVQPIVGPPLTSVDRARPLRGSPARVAAVAGGVLRAAARLPGLLATPPSDPADRPGPLPAGAARCAAEAAGELRRAAAVAARARRSRPALSTSAPRR